MSDVSADLPRDVLSDILVRLPAKSIGRSRCVSKLWLSLLTSYDFTKAHFAHHSHSLAQQQKILLCSSRSGPLYSLTLHLRVNRLRKLEFFDKEVFYLVGSCNGLVSVVTLVNKLWLINCLTKEYVKLPDSPFPLCGCYVFKKYGFRYDELSDDYTIVKISQCDWAQSDWPNCPEIYVDIYSLKMKSWRRLGNPLYGHDLPNYDSCVFINGAFHWIGMKLKSKYPHKDPFVVCAFDLSSETFQEIPAPPVFGDHIEISESACKLTVIDGCLGMVVNFHYPDKKTEIWYMKCYSVVESWTKLDIDIKPLCFHKDKILFQEWQRRSGDYNWFSQEQRNRDYKLYHLKDGRVEVCLVIDQEDAEWRYVCFDGGISYSESLLSPHFNSQN